MKNVSRGAVEKQELKPVGQLIRDEFRVTCGSIDCGGTALRKMDSDERPS
jgi:hypothetical protein